MNMKDNDVFYVLCGDVKGLSRQILSQEPGKFGCFSCVSLMRAIKESVGRFWYIAWNVSIFSSVSSVLELIDSGGR